MAPEQLDGDDAGPAADVYSLAAVAFEALSGRKARDGATPVEIAHRVATEPPPDLREAWPGAPAGAAEALKRGMASEPARPAARPPVSSRSPLERGLAEERDRPDAARAARRHARRATPAWLPVAAAALALALVGGAAIFALDGGDEGRSPEAGEPAGAERPAAKPARAARGSLAEKPAAPAPAAEDRPGPAIRPR